MKSYPVTCVMCKVRDSDVNSDKCLACLASLRIEDRSIIAAGPWFTNRGMLRCRVVLRALYASTGNRETDRINFPLPTKFVVHTEGVHSDGSHGGFCHGHYFDCYPRARTAVMTAFNAALKCWQEKVAEKCGDLDYDSLFPE